MVVWVAHPLLWVLSEPVKGFLISGREIGSRVGGFADLVALLWGERPGERVGADFVGRSAIVEDDAVKLEASGEGVFELRE